jgi:hypothetical protein
MSLSIASSKSAGSTAVLSLRAASSAASFTRFARSAPAKPAVRAATTLRSTGWRQLHVLGVDAKDFLASLHVRLVHQNLTIETSGPKQRRIEHFGPVGGRHDDDRLARVEAVHFSEQLVERLLTLLVRSHWALHTRAAERIELVDEDDARRFRLGLRKQIAHPRGARRRRTSPRTRSRSG